MAPRARQLVWLVVFCLLCPGSLGSTTVAADQGGPIPPKTWKTVAELTDEEKSAIDLRSDTPRDASVAYLPAEPFPFQLPYTAEEMALRAMGFPHSPFWDCILIDMAFSVTNSGFMDQRVTLIPILYFGNDIL